MNQIIIIGNGFDLAHGLKTSYSDYLLWLIKDLMKRSNEGGYSRTFMKDGPFNVKGSHAEISSGDLENFLAEIKDLKDLLTHGRISFDLKPKYSPFFSGDFEHSDSSTTFYYAVINLDSEFIESIISKDHLIDWVDIEAEYFDHLNEILKNHDEVAKKTESIKKLNEDLNFLKTKLVEYLKIIDLEFSNNPITKNDTFFTGRIRDLIYPRRVLGEWLEKRDYPHTRLIVNYNYTSLNKRYRGLDGDQMTTDVINIHGSIDDSEIKKIVFGFGSVAGDQLESIYTSGIRQSSDYLKHTQYHLNGQNSKLIELLESGPFTVRVIGHSCGTSDGTTLRNIFGHKDCKKISIAFRDEEELKDKIYSIYYHVHKDFKELPIEKMSDDLKFPQLKKIHLDDAQDID